MKKTKELMILIKYYHEFKRREKWKRERTSIVDIVTTMWKKSCCSTQALPYMIWLNNLTGCARNRQIQTKLFVSCFPYQIMERFIFFFFSMLFLFRIESLFVCLSLIHTFYNYKVCREKKRDRCTVCWCIKNKQITEALGE